jgi:FkbM family methyltransferase
MRFVKRSVSRVARLLGYDIVRRSHSLGSMDVSLERLKQNGLNPKVILDVGAHRATWSLLAKRVFPSANMLLVEPQEEMRLDLERFCASHPGSRFVLVAAGDRTGEMIQTIWGDLAGSSLLPRSRPDLLSSGRQRRVPMATIDSLVSECDTKPGLVKLDIQGFELDALRGAGTLFGTTESFILETSLFRFIDRQPDLYDVVTFMKERGYQVYDIAGALRRPLDRALGQVDLVFVRQDGPLASDRRWSSGDPAFLRD